MTPFTDPVALPAVTRPGLTASNPAEIGLAEIGLAEIRLAEIRLAEIRLAEIGLGAEGDRKTSHLPGTGFGDRLRHVLWRAALSVAGGIRVHGERPAGPCVLVANHRSHADTPALLAALSAARSPRVAASPAYWFSRPWRTLVCRHLAGAFPLHRPNGLDRAAELLAEGHLVIIYPEGTRSRDGSLGAFRPGAARLASRAGVPLVPVGISGTADMLPVHGRLRPGRITVRFGTPITALTPADALKEAREAVAQLSTASEMTDIPDSSIRQRLAAFAGSGAGLVTIFLWALAEAVVWPLIPEFALAVLCVAAPRKALRLGVAAALGSLCGGVLMYLLAAHGVHPPQPLTTARMHDFLDTQLAGNGARGLRHQAFNGIPFKVYATTAGETHVGLWPFLINCLPGRFLRIITIGLLLGGFGAITRRWRRWYPAYLAIFLVLFTLGLAKVIAYWS